MGGWPKNRWEVKLVGSELSKSVGGLPKKSEVGGETGGRLTLKIGRRWDAGPKNK